MNDRKPPTPPSRSIRGSALITVTFIGLFIMLVAAALVNSFATGEAQAIAHSLAKTRIYWASMGHINYALSRIQREGLCGELGCSSNDDGAPSPTDETSRANNLRSYLTELNNDTDGRNWNFGDGYSFKLTWSVADGPSPTPIPDDGRLRVTVTLAPVTGTPFDTLNGIEQRIRRNLVIDACLSASCAVPLPNTKTNGLTQIEELRRQ